MDNNVRNMMPSYMKIKIKNAVAGEETDSTEAEDEENDMEAERAAEVESKRKTMSHGGGSGRGGGAAAAPPYCAVESCGADLRACKKYHQKHRVCEVHAKAPVVLVDGFRQRFCQQCSRFHELSEFDQKKRSCRRRLAGHNERRRKSPFIWPHHPTTSGAGRADSSLRRRGRPEGSSKIIADDLNERNQGHQNSHIHPTRYDV